VRQAKLGAPKNARQVCTTDIVANRLELYALVRVKCVRLSNRILLRSSSGGSKLTASILTNAKSSSPSLHLTCLSEKPAKDQGKNGGSLDLPAPSKGLPI